MRLSNEVSISFNDLDYCALVSEAQRSGLKVQDLVRDAVAKILRSRAVPEVAALTTRELQTVRLIAEGHSNKIIGDKLGISESTARFHVDNVLRKWNVDGRAAAAAIAVRLGLA